jgi:tetratricopeptide (TPR) repeat protein
MLLDMGRYEEALAEYEATLKRSANRFNSLYGAGRAAELRGDRKTAAYYYQKLIQMTVRDNERERLRQARAFVTENQIVVLKKLGEEHDTSL